MINWLHHLLDPHCKQCMEENEEAKICASCEVLKQELAIAHQSYRELLNKLTERAPEAVHSEPPLMTKPRFVPWKVRQQILEKEDRIKAQAMKNAGKPTEELEKELDVAN